MVSACEENHSKINSSLAGLDDFTHKMGLTPVGSLRLGSMGFLQLISSAEAQLLESELYRMGDLCYRVWPKKSRPESLFCHFGLSIYQWPLWSADNFWQKACNPLKYYQNIDISAHLHNFKSIWYQKKNHNNKTLTISMPKITETLKYMSACLKVLQYKTDSG